MRTGVTSAPRACNASINSGFDLPYSWIAIRRSGRPSVTCSSSRQVFGSGATMAGTRSISRSAATGFGPRATMVTLAEGRGETPRRIQHARQLPRADAGQQDHHIEAAGIQPLGKREDGIVGRDRDLAHRRGHERHAPLLADQFGRFGGAAAFEREDANTLERHYWPLPRVDNAVFSFSMNGTPFSIQSGAGAPFR